MENSDSNPDIERDHQWAASTFAVPTWCMECEDMLLTFSGFKCAGVINIRYCFFHFLESFLSYNNELSQLIACGFIVHEGCKRDAVGCKLRPQENVGFFSHFVCRTFSAL